MDISCERSGTESKIVIAGEIDVDNAYAVYSAAIAAAENGAVRVGVDPSEVTFIDSIGLGMLIRTRDDLTRLYKSGLVLRNPSPRVRNLLAVTALTAEFVTET